MYWAVNTDFLFDSSQRVVLSNAASTFLPVTCGVPQESVLGPVLFLIYINDIVDLFDGSDVRVKLYADDIKIYLEITNACKTLIRHKIIRLMSAFERMLKQHLVSYDRGLLIVLHYKLFIDKITVWSHIWQLKLANNNWQHSRIGLSRSICMMIIMCHM